VVRGEILVRIAPQRVVQVVDARRRRRREPEPGALAGAGQVEGGRHLHALGSRDALGLGELQDEALEVVVGLVVGAPPIVGGRTARNGAVLRMAASGTGWPGCSAPGRPSRDAPPRARRSRT